MSVKRSEQPLDQAQREALSEQAERCRRLAQSTYNREMIEMLGNMAEDFERAAKHPPKARG